VSQCDIQAKFSNALSMKIRNTVSPKVDKRNGHPGVALWKILVCGVLRLDLNIDYDRLHGRVNQHGMTREMLGGCPRMRLSNF
jgi:predicted secreted protein